MSPLKTSAGSSVISFLVRFLALTRIRVLQGLWRYQHAVLTVHCCWVLCRHKYKWSVLYSLLTCIGIVQRVQSHTSIYSSDDHLQCIQLKIRKFLGHTKLGSSQICVCASTLNGAPSSLWGPFYQSLAICSHTYNTNDEEWHACSATHKWYSAARPLKTSAGSSVISLKDRILHQ